MPLPKQLRTASANTSKGKTAKKARRILANRYREEKRLGCGNFGAAYLVTDLKCKDEREKLKVLKEITIGDLQPDETVDAMHEASLTRTLDHPGIVKFYDSFVDGDFFCIITEFCEGGDLDDKMTEFKKKGKLLPESQVVEWIIQLLLAVQYMHDRKVLHRDLKARNIFLKNNVIKVGDFGISRILMGTTDMASTFVGTPYYMSPEVLKHEGYNSKSDVWSIGCILYELCALRHAFEGTSLMGVMYKIVEGSPPEWPKPYSSDLHEIFLSIMNKDPHQRPSAADVLKKTFVAKQMQLLKDSMIVKHNAKGQKDNISREYEIINNALKEDKRLEQLRKESDEKKWKNMTPRERMRFRKQQQADEAAKKIGMAVIQQHIDNRIKYEEIKHEQNPYQSNVQNILANHQDERQQLEEMTDAAFGHRPKTSPSYGIENTDRSYVAGPDHDHYRLSDEEEQEQGEDEDNELTVVESAPVAETLKPQPRTNFSRTLQPTGSRSEEHPLASRTLSNTTDNRPITPMKDRMVYDVRDSSLDFEDGIPTEKKLADTYYSQFDDEFEREAEEEGEHGNVFITADVGDGADDAEVEDLINCMQNALDKADTMKSHTLTLSSSMDAYGPQMKDIKIRNLRAEAQKKLGKDEFEKAYAFLKEMRFGTAGNASESDIMKALAKIVKNPNDCFLVDQLLFLEAQY